MFDVGTSPLPKALYHYYRTFRRNPHIGAISGELRTREILNENILIAAQHFEYKISNILDKSTKMLRIIDVSNN